MNTIRPVRATRRRRAAPVSAHRLASDQDLRHVLPQDTRLKFLSSMPTAGTPYLPQQPATRQLKELIEEHRYQSAFTAAVERVSNEGVPELSRIKTLDQFYFYIDTIVTWTPEIRHWRIDGQTMHERTVYLRGVQFYYYFNQPELEALQTPISPTSGERLSRVSRWLREFAIDWGKFLDTPASAEHLSSFKFAPEFNWQDYEKAPEEYQTFNEFFARRFSNIDELRPVARKDDDRTIVFPAESTFVGQWTISTAVERGPMPELPSIVVKHIQWPIRELLADSAYADAFAGGLLCHSFLNTYDYHRLHTPVAGRVIEAKFIPGQVYLQVELQTQDGATLPSGELANAIVPKRYLDADDPTGYQFVQCRGLLVLETARMGKVAVLPVGMAQVSSVMFTGPGPVHAPIRLSHAERAGKTYEEQVRDLNAKIERALVGRDLHKGEMFSIFQFGGSDCVVVFERKANITVTAARGVHYPIRSQYGVANFND
jgi:phosphatidylserine decarboxylase